MATMVRITSTYRDRTHTARVTVESPIPTTREALMDASPGMYDKLLAEWWEDVVFPHTGDGKGGHAVTEAYVFASDVPGLVGLTYTWEG